MAKHKAVGRGREVWTKRVARWGTSGLTAEEFAARHGLKASTLAYWKWRLGKDQRGGRERLRRGHQDSAVRELPSLIEVRATPADGRFELELTNGRKLRIPVGFEVGDLRNLLSTLEGSR